MVARASFPGNADPTALSPGNVSRAIDAKWIRARQTLLARKDSGTGKRTPCGPTENLIRTRVQPDSVEGSCDNA